MTSSMNSACYTLLLFSSCGLLRAESSVTETIDASGVTGGLVVHVGCADGRTTAKLRLNDRYLVHGLDVDPRNITAARQTIREKGCYGKVAVDVFDGRTLPYMDNLVNLIVVSSSECQVPSDEVRRVLAPRGVALFHNELRSWFSILNPQLEGDWLVFRKPVPEDIDEWPHYLHGPDNNAISQDTVVGPPKRLQWQCGPLWSRSHETDMSMTGAISVGGRLFYFIDDGPIGVHETPENIRRLPDKNSLVCRDAFNGLLLWKRPVPDWGSRAWDNNRWWKIRDQAWSSPQTLPRRLVAVENRVFVTLGYRTFLSELDAVTGETVREFRDVDHVEEILAIDGRLILRGRQLPVQGDEPTGDTLAVLDTASGKTLWRKTVGRLTELTLACDNGRISFLEGGNVVALDLKTGTELWKARVSEKNLLLPSLVMDRDTVIVATGGRAATACAFSALDGRRLWQQAAGQGSFRGAADVFVANDLLWMGTLSTTGIDPNTGKVVKEIDIPTLFTDGHHSRCYRARGTENYLLWSKRGVEFLDLIGENHSRNDWVRGTCRYGIIPANGLLYAPPTPCFCYPGVKLNGFNALAGASSVQRPESKAEGRLERGPAFSDIGSPPPALDSPLIGDWPAYRHNNARSGATQTTVPAELTAVWKTKVGSNLTPPVVARGRLFLADKESHSVHCLNAASGEHVWRCIVGGSVDSPPTVHGGRVLFGCTDGWVYCLDAEDGALAWRFQAAPRDQRIVFYGQIQSSWPVHGSVLVKNNTAYVVAGRSSFLDGGLFLYGLDVATGAIRCQNHLDGPWSNPNEKSPHGAHWMDGGRTDILVGGDDKLYMMQNVFDLELKQLDAPVIAPHGARSMDRHLVATGGFLDDTGFDRLFWMHTTRWPGLYYGYDAPKTGQILVFDQDTTYALHTYTKLFSRSPYFAPGRDGYELVADDNGNEPLLDPRAARREREPGYSRQKPPKWLVKVPLRVRAMVLAGEILFIAGPPDTIDEDDPLATFEGRKDALVWAVSACDGRKLTEYRLDAQPVFDGLIAVTGRLFLTTRDGHVLCLGSTPSG